MFSLSLSVLFPYVSFRFVCLFVRPIRLAAKPLQTWSPFVHLTGGRGKSIQLQEHAPTVQTSRRYAGKCIWPRACELAAKKAAQEAKGTSHFWYLSLTRVVKPRVGADKQVAIGQQRQTISPPQESSQPTMLAGPPLESLLDVVASRARLICWLSSIGHPNRPRTLKADSHETGGDGHQHVSRWNFCGPN